MGHLYRWSGLHLDSELELPELVSADPQRDVPCVRVELRYAEQASEQQLLQVESWMEARGNSLHFQLSGIAEFSVHSDRITILAHPSAPRPALRRLFLGTALGALSHLRRFIPIHASAARIGEEIAVFVGPAATGKSTLAAHLAAKQIPILSDDLCALHFRHRQAWIYPSAVPQSRTFRSDIAPFVPHSVQQGPQLEHLDYRAYRVTRIYAVHRHLDPENNLSFLALNNADAIAALVENGYRSRMAWDLGRRPIMLQRCASVINHTQNFALSIPTDTQELSRLCDRLIEHCQSDRPRSDYEDNYHQDPMVARAS